MLKIKTTNKFEKEYKKAMKSGKDLKKLDQVLVMLAKEIPLDERFYDHPLKGNYKDRRECHIEPDWLLIYKIEGDFIIFERTGSHSQLFK